MGISTNICAYQAPFLRKEMQHPINLEHYNKENTSEKIRKASQRRTLDVDFWRRGDLLATTNLPVQDR